jgi:hypothetical protein
LNCEVEIGFKEEALRKIWNGMQEEDLTTGNYAMRNLSVFTFSLKLRKMRWKRNVERVEALKAINNFNC